MNLPSEFKFRTSSGLFNAKLEGDGYRITDDGNSGGGVIWSRTKTKSNVKDGVWKIVEEKKNQHKYELIALQIGQLVDKKNAQYGDAFNKSDEFLKLLYPNGITTEQYSDMLAVVRIFDKLMRVANGNQGNENAFQDIAGYGILKAEGKANE